MEDLICKRCNLGIDDDSDGNCRICARWSDEEAWKMRLHVTRRIALAYICWKRSVNAI